MYTDRASSCSTGEPMLQPDADRSPLTCSPCYSLCEASWVYKTAVRHVNVPSFSIQDPPNCMLQWVPCALLYHMPTCRRYSRLKTLPKGEKLHGVVHGCIPVQPMRRTRLHCSAGVIPNSGKTTPSVEAALTSWAAQADMLQCLYAATMLSLLSRHNTLLKVGQPMLDQHHVSSSNPHHTHLFPYHHHHHNSAPAQQPKA